MNHPSLFSFEESSVCDPKVIRKHMIVPEDQLTKLNSIPGWTKVESYQNTLRLDKDFSIENSQSKSSINVTQNNKSIEKNTELFNEQTENRKKVLKAYEVFGQKLTRSSSLFTINKNCENLSNIKTQKRTLSLQSLCQSSDTSDLNIRFEELRCEYLSGRHSLPYRNITLTNQCAISPSDPEKKGELLFSQEVNSKNMEAVSQLPVSIPAFVEKDSLNFETTKESNSTLPVENAAAGSNNVPDIHMEHVATQFVNADKTDLLPKAANESNAILPSENVAPCSNNALDVPAKAVITSDVDNTIISTLNKFTESCVSVSIESYKSDTSSAKELPANEISASACPQGDTKPAASISNECVVSDLNSVGKIAPENVATLDNPAEESSIPKKDTVTETEDLIKGSGSDKVNDVKNDQKECHADKTYDPVKSAHSEATFSKKRKLESRNKRSKRIKSEEKQGNLKIRSIKKVGEVCYSVEEVKTMLDVMKQLL